MKACPYCGQQIQDEAIKCRFCGRDLRGAAAQPAALTPDPVPTAPAPARVGDGALRFSHSGMRYLLGYGQDFFGVWDREAPGGPVRRYPRTDDGWREAWTDYSAMEPTAVAVDPTPAASAPAAWSPPGSSGLAADVRSNRPVSPFLWALPVLFGWLGGLGAWFIVRDREPRTARNMLLLGIAISVVGIIALAARA